MAELFSRSLSFLASPNGEEGLTPGEVRLTMEELNKIKQLLYRIIRAVCPLTTEDPKDPDFDITLAEVYKDMNEHPEKYRK